MAELQPVGLDEVQEEVYRALVERPESVLGELRAALSAEAAGGLENAMATLVERGLVARLPGDIYTPVAPDVALDPLILRKESELVQARATAAELTDRFQRFRDVMGGDGTMRVSGRAQLLNEADRLHRRARGFLRALRPRSSFLHDSHALPGRGLTYRVVFDQEYLRAFGPSVYLERTAVHGAQLRIAPNVPATLLLFDDDAALIGDRDSGVVVRTPALLEPLSELFELTWQKAAHLAQGESAEEIAESDRLLLRVLASGAPDHDAARQLGISKRTIHRRVHDLMSRLGVASRFQIGVEACRRGWI